MEPSGAQWCARFPTSALVSDLDDSFRPKVEGFLRAVQTGGGSASLQATRRPTQRAYLMHWAWGLVHGFPANMCPKGLPPNTPIKPGAIPKRADVEIDWTHAGNLKAAKDAARAMIAGYHMAYPAALEGRHIDGKAIDMSIAFRKAAKIVGGDGIEYAIEAGATGVSDSVIALGNSFGLFKLPNKKDPPHWSIDGH